MDISKENGITSGLGKSGRNVQHWNQDRRKQLEGCGKQKTDDTEDYLGVLSIQDKAVITSGGYNDLNRDGEFHHHIINQDRYPAENRTGIPS